jgi:TPR repeat protein
MLGLMAATGCASLGGFHIDAATKLCAENGGVYCTQLGDDHLRATWTSMSKAWGLGIHKGKARDAYLHACELGEKSACARLLEYRLLTDDATLAQVEGQLQGMLLRSDEAIEADLEKEAQQAADFDATLPDDSLKASDVLGATSTVLGQQASVTNNAHAAQNLQNASTLTGSAADLAKAAEDAQGPKTARRVPPGEGHRLLLDRRGDGRASSLGVAASDASRMSLLGLHLPPPAAPPRPVAPPRPREDAAAPIASTGGPVPAGPANEAAMVQQALSTSAGDNTAAFARKQCQDKPADCFGLASAYSNGSFGLPKDPNIGVALFQRACEGGELNGCVMVLNITWSGQNGATIDKPRAKTAARSACGRGSASACHTYARVMDTGPDEKQYAEDQLLKQCDGGAPDGCHYLVSGDFKSARGKHLIEQLEAQCQQKKGSSCFYLDTYRKAGSIP